MNKEKIINYLEELNKTENIKVQDSKKTRMIFKSNKVFEIFGKEGVLEPHNDYTYKWLSSFLNNVIDLLNKEEFKNFEELEEKINERILEWADGETGIYTSDLTEWLNDNNSNVYYLTKVSKKFGETDGFKNLQLAQYTAIEELFNNALGYLIDNLREKF